MLTLSYPKNLKGKIVNEDTEFKNDYDRIADELESISLDILASLRETALGDCTPVNDKQFLGSLRQLKALHGWVEGLADTHRKAQARKAEPARG